jgi:hypothetical protein
MQIQERGFPHRFASFIGRVVKHLWTIGLTIIGSAALTIPAWIRPLLSTNAQRDLDRYTVLPVIAYWWLAVGVLVIGFLLACFFVSEEDRVELQREQTARREAETKLANPLLEGDLLPGTRWSDHGTSVEAVFKIRVRNTGLVASIARGFQLEVPPTDTDKVSLVMGPTASAQSPNIAQGTSQNQPHDDLAIQPGSAREFTVAFNIPLTVAFLHAHCPRIAFVDIKNQRHVIAWIGV